MMTFELPLVLIAVFASVALAIGALVSYALTWTTPEQREIRRLVAARRRTCWRSCS